MTISDYDKVYDLWMHTPGMGLNDLDDSREGSAKYLRNAWLLNCRLLFSVDGCIIDICQ